MTTLRPRAHVALAAASLLFFADAWAADGRIEISQPAALDGGVTAGDAAGFPVTVSEAGSYVLTSNLVVADPDQTAIEITSSHVTIDLNGFHVSGPATCSGSPGSISCSAGGGIGIAGVSATDVVVRGGRISGFASGGIALGDDSTVSDLHAEANGLLGIQIGNGSRAENNRATGNGGEGISIGSDGLARGNTTNDNQSFGMILGNGTAFGSNVANGNGQGPMAGGVPLDENLCEGGVCQCSNEAEICDYVDNDCDGAIDNGWLNPTTGKYEADTGCGNCQTNCQALSAANATFPCDATGVPTCTLVCDSGFQDLNGNPADGCEYAENTDAIYVSESDPSASDASGCGRGPTGSGAGNYPCASISAGIAEAGAAARSKVRIANGFYLETVTLVSGIDLLGGHDPNYWQQDTASTATVVWGNTSPGTHDKTLVAQNITAPTVVEGLVIHGETNAATGGNSYAVWVAGSTSALTIRDNRISAGVGGRGAGGSAGSNGAGGVDGAAGGIWYDSGSSSSSGCAAAPGTPVLGGGGGSSSCGGVDGGNGANAVCPVNNNLQGSGSTGLGAAGGSGGSGGYDYQSGAGCSFINTGGNPNAGSVAVDGGEGSAGSAGAGCSTPGGSVSGNEWAGFGGSFGGPGTPGSGGGGGGAGGGLDDNDGCSYNDILGGAGGGGGGGGCAGAGGSGGSGGGGAFGIFVTFASTSSDLPLISGNQMIGGSGGPGGTGGSGGVGAPGGAGGSGGTVGGPQGFALGPGGDGGEGGEGGDAGGGGGGCGGGAYGIYVHNHGVTPDYAGSNTFVTTATGGAGGTGGLSWAGPGGTGTAGTAANVNF